MASRFMRIFLKPKFGRTHGRFSCTYRIASENDLPAVCITNAITMVAERLTPAAQLLMH